jgi:hypothetical protein
VKRLQARTLEGQAKEAASIGMHLEFLEPSALIPTFLFLFHVFDGHELHICISGWQPTTACIFDVGLLGGSIAEPGRTKGATPRGLDEGK